MRAPFLLLLLLFSYFSIADPSDFPAKPNPPRLVNDFAGMLRPDEQNEIEHKLKVFNDSTSIEISVVIISNIGDYAIDDYAAQLGDAWGIGKKSKDNGVLILIAKENRKAFIATGYGMEGVLPDARCKRIITNELIPQFKKSDYYDGIQYTIDAIIQYSSKEYKADPVEKSGIKPVYVFLFILVVIIVIGLINRKNNGNNNSRNTGGGFGMFGPSLGGGFGGYGGGGYSGGSSGGGGFGGFGGGGFGGGGAGGDW
jgi:uncharacterized protein